MVKERRRFESAEKVKNIREHLLDGKPLSQVSEKYGIRVNTPLSLADAQRLIADFVDHYNNTGLHSAIGYITPKDKLAGRSETILDQRESKLAVAREARRAKRKAS